MAQRDPSVRAGLTFSLWMTEGCCSHFFITEANSRAMPEDVPPGLTPFVFSDPLGKRWPRLRIVLLITGVLVFFATVLFVETLFIAPRMTAPFSLRQLKGQLKSLQKQNPAVQSSTPNSLLWQKFQATKQATKKIARQTVVGSPSATPARSRRKPPENEVRLAFYTNGDP
jgi:hypothetical protein